MTTIRANPYVPNCFPTPTAQVDPRTYERAQFQQVCHTLQAGFRELAGFSIFGSGTIDMNELYAAAQGKKGGPQVQAAAQWLLAHPQYVTELETRGNANPDGKISLGDLDKEVGLLDREQQLERLRYDPRLDDFHRSVATIAQYLPMLDTAGGGLFNAPDGKISKKDLDAVITGTQYPPELRQAAFFMSMNPDLLGVLDTAAKGGRPDGVVSGGDLQTLLAQLGNVRSTMPPVFVPPMQRY